MAIHDVEKDCFKLVNTDIEVGSKDEVHRPEGKAISYTNKRSLCLMAY